MHRLYTFAFALAMPLVFPLAASAASRPMTVPADSFINLHVDSVPQLTQQVTLDPTVRRRLARHFHVSGPALVRYIQDNLVLRKTTRAGRYQVYCVSRTGREYSITARLPLGTPVFVLRTTGQPILKLACGNPMTALLPVVKKAGSVATLPDMASLQPPVPAAPIKIAPELAPSAPVVVAAAGKPVVYVMPAPVTKIAGGLYELPAPSSHFPLGFLAGIPIIAGLATHHGGSNGNTGTTGGTGTTGSAGTGTGIGTGTGTGTTGGMNTGFGTNSGVNSGTNTGTDTSPVPEPSTSAAFAIGGVGLAILLAGGRRRRRIH